MMLPVLLLFLAAMPDVEHKVDDLFRPVAGEKNPGASIAVVRDGKVLLMKSYGMADVEKGIVNSPSTIFRLASVTKSFTAIAALQLIDEGKLALDDPLSKYVNDYPHAGKIQIRHLLSHTSGVPDFISYEEVLKRPLEFEPGSRINYSNNGYQLLGRAIEKASGQTWEEYLKAHVFGPLGMKHSGYDKERALPGRATGHLLGKAGYEPVLAEDARGAWAGGGLYSSVEDLVRFERGLGKLLKRATLEQAWTPTALSGGRKARYGFGWMTSNYRGLREVAHGGDITGFNTWVSIFPDEKLSVIVLSNVGMRPPGPLPTAEALTHKIAEIYLGDRMEKPGAARKIAVEQKVLESYVGKYKIDAAEIMIRNMGSHIVITRDGERLVAEAGGMKLPLDAKSESVFQAPGSPVELTFEGGAKMMITLMGLREFPAYRVQE